MSTYLLYFRLENIKAMSKRVIEMRKRLRDILERLGTPGNWSHITSQIGMFSYTGLTGKQIFYLQNSHCGNNNINPLFIPEHQVQYLIEKYHIYALKSGRISMCSLSDSNIDYVANAIHDSVVSVK